MVNLVLDRELLTYDDVLLVPQKALRSRHDADIKSYLTKDIQLEMPLIAANMDSISDMKMLSALDQNKSLGILHRYATLDEIKELLTSALSLKVISVGVNSQDIVDKILNYIEQTPKAGLDAILVDIANGYSEQMTDMVSYLQKHAPQLPVIAGNVATSDGARFLCDLGVNAIKVGIGPGSICSTRLKTGHGYPQLSAIIECAEIVKDYPDVKIIGDGGIKQPGDVLKALAAGADTVMAGSIFSKCREAAGKLYERDGKTFRQYRGMASWQAQLERLDQDGGLKPGTCSEGEVIEVEVTTTLQDLLSDYLGGVRSGFSYSGARTTTEFKRRAKLVKISGATNLENSVRGQIIPITPMSRTENK